MAPNRNRRMIVFGWFVLRGWDWGPSGTAPTRKTLVTLVVARLIVLCVARLHDRTSSAQTMAACQFCGRPGFGGIEWGHYDHCTGVHVLFPEHAAAPYCRRVPPPWGLLYPWWLIHPLPAVLPVPWRLILPPPRPLPRVLPTPWRLLGFTVLEL